MPSVSSSANSYIFGALRSPMFKTARGKKLGSADDIHPVKLASAVIKQLVLTTKVPREAIEDVIVGCATPTGKQGFNVGRLISNDALGQNAPGTQCNRLCGSGSESIRNAAALVKSGDLDLIIAGGVEHMGAVPMGADMMPPLAGSPGKVFSTFGRILKLQQRVINDTLPPDYEFVSMGKSGDLIARKYGFKRYQLDEVALKSQQNAAIASLGGRFLREIVPFKGRKGSVSTDEGIRANTTMSGLAGLKPSFGDDGLHTAGNSSQITDGAAFLLIGNDKAKDKYGLTPRAKIIATKVIGSDLQMQLDGPIKAIGELLKSTGRTVKDIDLFEINEAFASVVLATQKELGIPAEKLNVNGGAIALGHPLGCSGARLPVTLIHELERRDLKTGIYALCIGGAQAYAILIERC